MLPAAIRHAQAREIAAAGADDRRFGIGVAVGTRARRA
jgi:hypothetical protein